MEVDEARGDHVASGVDGLSAFNRVRGDYSDTAVLDAHIGDTVILGLRIHHPAVVDHDVIGLGHGLRVDHDGHCTNQQGRDEASPGLIFLVD